MRSINLIYDKIGNIGENIIIHPVSITRFPLTRFSPGSGLLRNPCFTLSTPRFSRVWVRKDGNLVMEKLLCARVCACVCLSLPLSPFLYRLYRELKLRELTVEKRVPCKCLRSVFKRIMFVFAARVYGGLGAANSGLPVQSPSEHRKCTGTLLRRNNHNIRVLVV